MTDARIRDSRYTIKLDQFEGPFDLLIELARSRELELSQISLTEITDDFLQFMESEEISSEMKGDFLIVAATLLLLKIKAALPRLSEEEEEEAQSLALRLQIYQLYRTQAEWVRANWQTRPLLESGAFGPGLFSPVVATPAVLDISGEELAQTFEQFLGRLKQPATATAHLQPRGRSLRECLQLFAERLQQASQFSFQQTIKDQPRSEAAISFLAVLEMARRNHVTLQQVDSFAELIVRKTND